MRNYRKETLAVRFGDTVNQASLYSQDVVTPIHLSTTNFWRQIDKPGPFEYTRSSNPTRQALEQQLAALEHACFGLAFSSGMAAETAVILGTLKSGDHIIGYDDLYGGTKRLFNSVFNNFGIAVDYIDVTNAELLQRHVKPNTRMIWLETPTNPLMKLADIEAIAKFAKSHNILVVVDNTFLTPYFQNPLDLGADIVVHSGTKYFGGHSDVLNGAIMLNDETLYQSLYNVQNSTGGVLSPFDSYLVLRGLKTLPIRMNAHEQNALHLAQYLEQHPAVTRVYYPGLKSHSQFELAQKQARGAGGMISFELKGGVESCKKLFDNLELFILAESLGGVESLIEHPAAMTHASLSKEEQRLAGITDSLIRVSVGIEHIDDLIEDMEQALAKI
ncbi:MAG: PLP-dependent aspartate aminotransferase family protein [Bacteroidota bacterium]|nr:PLP-dependent aspartate aminotransferase family protein [Bacteroidota bacterium]